jgi:hypothetical protein
VAITVDTNLERDDTHRHIVVIGHTSSPAQNVIGHSEDRVVHDGDIGQNYAERSIGHLEKDLTFFIAQGCSSSSTASSPPSVRASQD